MVYAPAMHVLVEDRLPSGSKSSVRQLLSGQELLWDRPPLANESWRVYSGISSAIAQVARLFGKEVEFDQWGDMGRLTLTTLSWEPLPYDFGWHLACRPFGGVVFRDDPKEMPPPLAVRYVESWPHGYFTLDELKRFEAPLREIVIQLVARCQPAEDPLDIDRAELEMLLMEAHTLSNAHFVDLFGTFDDEDMLGWQVRRALLLLRAVAAARAQGKDLIAVGY